VNGVLCRMSNLFVVPDRIKPKMI